MTLHQLMELKKLDFNAPAASASLQLLRNDKARADKMLKEILALIPPSATISPPKNLVY